MTVFEFTAENGIPFRARLVRKGECYGLNNCLIHTGNDSLIEFYDARFPHCEHGQFVSRYSLPTLQARDGASGLNLAGGINDWQIDGASLQAVLKNLTA